MTTRPNNLQSGRGYRLRTMQVTLDESQWLHLRDVVLNRIDHHRFEKVNNTHKDLAEASGRWVEILTGIDKALQEAEEVKS